MTSGCSDSDSRLSPFRWQSIDAEFDSLTIAFDYATWRAADVDSIARLAEKAATLAAIDSDNILKQSRVHYFKGVEMFKRSQREEATLHFSKARNMLDSATYPYEVRRIDFWLVDARREHRSVEDYRRTMDNIKFYESIGDSPMLAMQYGDLGLLLKKYGDIDEARKALQKSYILFLVSGLKEQAMGNMINIASCFEKSGRKKEAAEVLYKLTADSTFKTHPTAYPLALLNLYDLVNDTAALIKAMPLITANNLPLTRRLRGGAFAQYAEMLAQRGATDSMYIYSTRAIDNLASANMGDSAYIYLIHSRVLERKGDISGALAALKMSRDVSERMWNMRQAESVRDMTTSRLLGDARMQAELAYEHRKMIWAVATFSLLVVLLIIVTVWLRERHRRQLQSIRTEMEKGTLQRKIMSMQIATKDNDSFLYTFASINPNFTRRLKDAYPELSAMDLKLAAFAALKLDIKQVARILGIKPESVKQSRWRLRRKLGLTPDQNLEDALQPYLDEVQQ